MTLGLKPLGFNGTGWQAFASSSLISGGQQWLASKVLLLAVSLNVCFGRLSSIFGGMEVVSMGQVRVVSGLLVIAGLMVLRRFPMMPGGMLVVFDGLQVMRCCCF